MQTRDIPRFKQFDLPTFEVITPHTKHHIPVRSMLVEQEEMLKTSSLNPAKTVEMINRVVYDCMPDHAAPFETFESFEKNITMADREALIYGLIIATYGEWQDFSFQCPRCGKSVSRRVNLTENVKITLYNGAEPLLEKFPDVELPVSGAKAILQLPTLYTERVFANSKGVGEDVLRKADDYIIVKKLQLPSAEPVAEGEVPKMFDIDNVFEIYAYMRRMPAGDRKVIYKEWSNIYGDYGIQVMAPHICPQCEARTEMYINMLQELFRISQ